jgi:AcrR family transcriptional regulator
MAPKVTEEHRERQKLKILDAAKQAFMKKGFEPVTMKDIVEESGFSRGGVYFYFSSTEEIFTEIIESEHITDSESVRKHVESNRSMWKAIDDYLVEFANKFEKVPESIVPAQFEYFLTSWRNEERKGYLQIRYERAVATIKTMIEKGKQTGEFKPKQPIDVIAKYFVTVCDGIVLQLTSSSADEIQAKEQLDALRLYLKYALSIY